MAALDGLVLQIGQASAQVMVVAVTFVVPMPPFVAMMSVVADGDCHRIFSGVWQGTGGGCGRNLPAEQGQGGARGDGASKA